MKLIDDCRHWWKLNSNQVAAFWALLGPDVELRCANYDVDAALPVLLGAGFPPAQRLFGASLVDPAPKSVRVEWYESQRA